MFECVCEDIQSAVFTVIQVAANAPRWSFFKLSKPAGPSLAYPYDVHSGWRLVSNFGR